MSPTIARRPTTTPRLLLLAAVASVVLGSTLFVSRASGPPPPPLNAPVNPIYPDLGMAPLTNLLVGHEADGSDFLRFSATIVNVGSGELLVAAHRSHPVADDWRVVQRVVDGVGGYSERRTDATMAYAGDAHDHWHVAGAEAHQLETVDGEVVASLVKIGFCFFDNVPYDPALPEAAAEVSHTSAECGTRFDRDVAMGLSVGWGDEYQWYLLGQTVDITTVPDGRYRLRAIADPANWFAEVDETNNDTWTLVDLSSRHGRRIVEVVEQGPSARR